MTPTREEIQSTSFTEYVQHALFDDDYDSDQENGVKAAIVSLTPDEEQNRPSTCTSGAAATLEAKRAKQLRNRLIRWDDGVVKITLPKGWWDEAGIAKDRTARGPAVSCTSPFAVCVSSCYQCASAASVNIGSIGLNLVAL